MTLNATQYETFIELLPKTSICADNYKFGSHIRNKAHAIKHQHIELNNHFVYNFISLDIDYPISENMSFVWETQNLPEPTYAVINPANNHAHLIFQLEKPVYANNAPQLSYFQDVKQILIEIYNADINFTETLTKNPLHEQWKTIFANNIYTLDELKAYAPKRTNNNIIRFNKYKRRTLDKNNADLGHRCLLFETSRMIAYNSVKDFADQTDFFNYMIGVCQDQNPSDLKYSDILSTAKSISRYTWKNRERYSRGYIRNKVSSREELKQRQQKAAATTAQSKAAKTLAAIEQAITNIIKHGVAMPTLTKQSIAKLSGKSLSTIKRYSLEIDRFIRCIYQVLSPVLPSGNNKKTLAHSVPPLSHVRTITPLTDIKPSTTISLERQGDISKPSSKVEHSNPNFNLHSEAITPPKFKLKIVSSLIGDEVKHSSLPESDLVDIYEIIEQLRCAENKDKKT